MKYCTKCGKELYDEAIMCTGCGCMVAPLPKQEETKTAPANTNKGASLVSVFNFISVIIIALGVFHLFLALIGARVYTNLSFYNDYNYYLHSSFDPDYDIIASSFALGIIAAGFSLTSLIITSVKRLKLNYILTAIAELVIAALLIIATGPSL
jgi:hypothetical protein